MKISPVPGTYTVSIRARGDQGCNVWPEMSVLIDDQLLGVQSVNTTVATTYQFVDAIVDSQTPHTLSIAFRQTGECQQAGQDVNLYVSGIALLRTGEIPRK